MSNQNPVVVDSEHARSVLTCALWRIVSEQVVGVRDLSDACFSVGWRAIHPAYALDDDPAELEYRLARIAIIRRAIRRVSLTPIGSAVELPVSVEQLEEALVDCMQAIDQSGELLATLPAEDLGHVHACRDAAASLVERLRDRAAAVEPGVQDGGRLDEAHGWLGDAPGIDVPAFMAPITISRVHSSRRLVAQRR